MSQIDDIYFSSENFTTILLGADETFTGGWEYVGRHKSIGFSCFSDTEGTLYVDYSVLDENTGARIVRTLPPYYIPAGINQVHTLMNFRPWVRLRFVNSSSAQTDFDLSLVAGQQNQPVAPNQFSYNLYADAQLTRPLANDVDIAAGRAAGISFFEKFGRNTAVTTTEDICFQGDNYDGFPTSGTAETLDIVSASTNDDEGGSGAEKILVSGLDANWDLATEEITLNGQTTVTTTSTWRRVNRAYVTQSANGANTAFNAGNITVTNTTSGNTFLVIPAGFSQSQVSAFTVPRNHVLLVRGARITLNKASGSATAVVGGWFRPFGGSPTLIEIGTASVGSPYELGADCKIVIPEKADVAARCISVSSGSLDIFARFYGELIRTSNEVA